LSRIIEHSTFVDIDKIMYTSRGVHGDSCTSDDLLRLLTVRYGGHIKLELGPGRIGGAPWGKAPWATIGLNHSSDPHSDIYYDLSRGIPLPDKSVDEIHSNQVLEHLRDPIKIMNEQWRVLKPGGFVYACVPHYLAPSACGDPTHRTFWSETSFQYYCLRDDGTPFVDRFSDYGIKCRFILEEHTWQRMVHVTAKLRKPL
jgi:SAM-dependent methyltransferase